MSQVNSYLSNDGFRVLGTWFTNVIKGLWTEEKVGYITTLNNSAWAAGNSVNVGMAETAEVLNAMLAQPSTEQIYTTQPQWAFREGQQLIIGSYVDINASGTLSTVIYANGVWSPATPPTGYTRYAIPSLIYDKRGSLYPHVVFPAWMAVWDGHYIDDEGALIDSQYEDSVYAGTGDNEGRYFCGDLDDEEVWPNYVFGFHPIVMTYHHNTNIYGGGLDGFVWQEVEGSAYTPGEGDTHLTFRTENAVKVGSWCKFTDENSKVYYGFVSAVTPDGDYESVTINGVGFESDGSEITKVELYKPAQG